MKRILLPVLVILLASCGGGGQSTQSDLLRQTPPANNGEPALEIVAVKSGSDWRVELFAANAVDLYQAAASISFPFEKYEVLLVSAGGGLGSPQTSFFAGKETIPGVVDFAYTQRFEGAGSSGNLRLVSIKVTPLDEFNIHDFSLETTADSLVIRNSAKQALVFRTPGVAGE